MSNKNFYYKGIKVNAFGIPVKNSEGNIRKLHKKKAQYYKSFQSSFRENSPKKLIVMYDIPHELKKERDWFRRQLINFGYIMIQKSVWVGPSPLPKQFLYYLKEIKIGNKFKTFKLAKPYNSSISAMA